jgi:hypothetical protein
LGVEFPRYTPLGACPDEVVECLVAVAADLKEEEDC